MNATQVHISTRIPIFEHGERVYIQAAVLDLDDGPHSDIVAGSVIKMIDDWHYSLDPRVLVKIGQVSYVCRTSELNP